MTTNALHHLFKLPSMLGMVWLLFSAERNPVYDGVLSGLIFADVMTIILFEVIKPVFTGFSRENLLNVVYLGLVTAFGTMVFPLSDEVQMIAFSSFLLFFASKFSVYYLREVGR